MHKGYGMFYHANKKYRAHRFIWEYHNGEIPFGKVIDHLCHNRACVNIDHLRVTTVTENNQYLSGAQAGSKSGIRNVNWQTSTGKWIVQIVCQGESYYFGRFENIEEAAVVAERARAELFGEFAGRG